MNNIEVAKKLLQTSKKILKIGKNVKINFVKDRPGHDLRYAINSNKIIRTLGWKPKTKFKIGISNTIMWYLNNKDYFKNLKNRDIIKRFGNK